VEGSTLWAYTSPKIGSIVSPSVNGAIVDSDRALPGMTSAETAYSNLPDKPVHGGTRNYGFFDCHVSSLSANTNRHAETMTTGVQKYGWFNATR
jgi:prepilin-type processing-associated H-X9-DG protein